MTIFKYNFKRIIQNKGNWLLLILLPAVLMGILFSQTLVSNTYKVAIIDEDLSQASRDLTDLIDNEAKLVEIEDVDEIKDGLLDRKFDYAVIFPEGLEDKLKAAETPEVIDYSLEESNVAGPMRAIVNSYLSSAVQIAGAITNPDNFDQAMKDYLTSPFSGKMADITETDVLAKSTFQMSLGIAAMCILLLLTFSTTIIVKDKESSFLARIEVTGTSRLQYQIETNFAYFTIALIQIGLLLTLAQTISKYQVAVAMLGKIFIIFALFALAAISLGGLVASFSSNSRQSTAIISLITIPMSMLGGLLWDQAIMPDWLQKFSLAVPTTWIMKGAEGALNLNNDLYIKSLLILLGFTIAFTLLSLLGSKEK
ncbi:MAG: ABC transporter permease [Clostridiaceae bacterium]|nr:ABC transporter permease [Clostridiaceae bacterium]